MREGSRPPKTLICRIVYDLIITSVSLSLEAYSIPESICSHGMTVLVLRPPVMCKQNVLICVSVQKLLHRLKASAEKRYHGSTKTVGLRLWQP